MRKSLDESCRSTGRSGRAEFDRAPTRSRKNVTGCISDGQPKVHKVNYPLRPIISSIGLYNDELSKYFAELIKNNQTPLSFSYIGDSFDFVRRICGINNSKDQVIISFGIDNLYTNVPVQEAS